MVNVWTPQQVAQFVEYLKAEAMKLAMFAGALAAALATLELPEPWHTRTHLAAVLIPALTGLLVRPYNQRQRDRSPLAATRKQEASPHDHP